MTDKQKFEELLTRAVQNIYPNPEFLESLLASGRSLSVYFGIDPTAPSLHLGHSISLLKLRDFQELGHRIILLIGDFTAMIGDPTDKNAVRRKLSREEVLKNAADYKSQASKIIDFEGKNPAELRYNSEWLSQLSFARVLELASNLTHAQTIKRNMFQERLKAGKDIYLHEFLYPLMQGYDSLAMEVDGEIGGNDQTFNMLVGRDLMKKLKSKEKFVLVTKLLADPSGKKMGKTEDNMVELGDGPNQMFGKIMSWPDEMIEPGFELLTRLALEETTLIVKESAPRDTKMRLAEEIVKIYHGGKEAKAAKNNFVATFQKGEAPADVKELAAKKGSMLSEVLLEAGLISSKSEFRRLVAEAAITIENRKITDPMQAAETGLVRVGKHRFLKIKVK